VIKIACNLEIKGYENKLPELICLDYCPHRCERHEEIRKNQDQKWWFTSKRKTMSKKWTIPELLMLSEEDIKYHHKKGNFIE
jgi:hypothetical protein